MIIIEELVEKTKHGNNNTYYELFSLVEEDLLKIARAKLHNEDNVKEVCQITYIRGYENIKKLRNNKYFKTWITRILINECNNIHKNRKRFTNNFDIDQIPDDNQDYLDSNIDFENIIKYLNEKEKNIFRLYSI